MVFSVFVTKILSENVGYDHQQSRLQNEILNFVWHRVGQLMWTV